MTDAPPLYERHGRVISLLSQAWETYAREFPLGDNFEGVLWHITQAQELVFAENALRSPTSDFSASR
jgi:hypothetical protein